MLSIHYRRKQSRRPADPREDRMEDVRVNQAANRRANPGQNPADSAGSAGSRDCATKRERIKFMKRPKADRSSSNSKVYRVSIRPSLNRQLTSSGPTALMMSVF